MKKILFIALLIFPALSKAQKIFPIDSATNKATFTGIVQVQGTKDSLYSKAMEYLAMNINSIKHAIELQDKDAGQLTAKFTIEAPKGFIGADLYLFFKNDKYKYIITNLHFTGDRDHGSWDMDNNKVSVWQANMFQGDINKTKQLASDKIKQFIAGLYKAETTKAASDF